MQFSVRAQDYILRKGLTGGNRSIDYGHDGLPHKIGAHAPDFKTSVELNNYLEEGGVPKYDNYTDPADQ